MKKNTLLFFLLAIFAFNLQGQRKVLIKYISKHEKKYIIVLFIGNFCF